MQAAHDYAKLKDNAPVTLEQLLTVAELWGQPSSIWFCLAHSQPLQEGEEGNSPFSDIQKRKLSRGTVTK